MRYYVVADVHGFGTLLVNTLKEKGFFDDEQPHKLVVCGDLMDRGKEACYLQEFILDLLRKDQLIFVRGNHEDLMVDMLNNFDAYKTDILWGSSHHNTNGTFDTALQLSQMQEIQVAHYQTEFLSRVSESVFIKELIPHSVNYYETPHYVFVHGWIPCNTVSIGYGKHYYKRTGWRRAGQKAWNIARWSNGMDAVHDGVTVRGKTIVCGHWHCSYGHARYEANGSEFSANADFSPYYADGIIAIDACTVHSHQINCLVIDD